MDSSHVTQTQRNSPQSPQPCLEMCTSIEISGPTPLCGSVRVEGAKNAVLVILASLLLTRGKSTLRNVPPSADVVTILSMFSEMGITSQFDMEQRTLYVDTSDLRSDITLSAHFMRSIRASALFIGPLLARFGHVKLVEPGGDKIGVRPIDFHLKAFQSMGAKVEYSGEWISVCAAQLRPTRFILEYPSVGATENIMMAAAITQGTTTIVNAALEPEVLDLARVLEAMGACIQYSIPGTMHITGTSNAQAVDHTIIPDRLETGTFLCAAAATGGSITVVNGIATDLDVTLSKLSDMGHHIAAGTDGIGIQLTAAQNPKAVSFRTMPYPGFPTDLQPLMMVAQLAGHGESHIMETVWEHRFLHALELQKMGARMTFVNRLETTMHCSGEPLIGTDLVASDIRAGAALAIAACAAHGTSTLTGLGHIRRGYVDFFAKLQSLGARIVPK